MKNLVFDLPSGQQNEKVEAEVDLAKPFHIAPIDVLLNAYLLYGKIGTTSQLEAFIERNKTYEQIIIDMIDRGVDCGAIEFCKDSKIKIFENNNFWSRMPGGGTSIADALDFGERVIPDFIKLLSHSAFKLRKKNLGNLTNFSYVMTYPDTPEITDRLLKASVDFTNELRSIAKFVEENKITSNKIIGVSLSSSTIYEELFL